ncbi:hypothetical protein ACMAZF_08570 [Psychrobium sp. nBUS_13]|uniref:hypothetical protein n=1 Tax=Psychrobium sp. nBUS_13 TaxID=3395319 RepID=UPI003EB6969D
MYCVREQETGQAIGLYQLHYVSDLVVRSENQLKQGARLTNSWLLGLRATPF